MISPSARRDVLSQGLRPIYEAFAERVDASRSGLKRVIDFNFNDSFLSRSYVSFHKDAQGDEVAVCVDAVVAGNQVRITLDVVMDNGEIIAQAPDTTIPVTDLWSATEGPLAQWLAHCQAFLSESFPVVAERVLRL